jgi:hypothetical protein
MLKYLHEHYLTIVILGRFLRYYQSMRMVAQVGDDQYAANNVSKALTPPGGIGIKYL